MLQFIHVQFAATWCSMSRQAATLFVRFAFGRTTTSSSVFRLWLVARTASAFTSRSGSLFAVERASFGSQETSDHRHSPSAAIRSGVLSIPLTTYTCAGNRKPTMNDGVHPVSMRVYTTGEMIIGCLRRTPPNHALHLTPA